jgi:undecaprenyl-diphosphatase
LFSYIFQGILQGLTEFLPVSSSGHLTLFQHFSGSHDLETNMLTDISLHFGTLLAVIFFFRADLLPYFTPAGWKDAARRRVAFLIIAGSIPPAIIGLSFKKNFEALFSMPRAVCIALFLTGTILLISEKLKKHSSQTELCKLSWFRSLAIGVAQGLAITPGISRSGSTIAAGLLLGLKGEEAAKFSFLLMIPAVGGATLLEFKDLAKTGLPANLDLTGLVSGTLAATLTGFLALKFLVYIIKEQKLSYFSYYLFLVSITSFILIQFAGK